MYLYSCRSTERPSDVRCLFKTLVQSKKSWHLHFILDLFNTLIGWLHDDGLFDRGYLSDYLKHNLGPELCPNDGV